MNTVAIFQSLAERDILTKREKERRLSEKSLSCPKCKEKEIRVVEVIEAESSHVVRNGVWIHSEDNNEYGDIIRIECTCLTCGHEFTSRRGVDFGNYYKEEA